MNVSKARSSRWWLIWKANGAVRLHDNPVIARGFRANALAELEGRLDDVKPLGSPAPVRTGDLVVHVPADGSRGYGLLYAHNADARGYGGDASQVAVAVFSSGTAGWVSGLPRNELVVAGHFPTTRHDRTGSGFTLDALRRMAPVIDAAQVHRYAWFPTFSDGRADVLLSEMHASRIRVGYIVDAPVANTEACTWESPGSISDQTVYAVPSDGRRTYVETTAHTGKFLLMSPRRASGDRQASYVVIQST